jgi:hypothetical protein
MARPKQGETNRRFPVADRVRLDRNGSGAPRREIPLPHPLSRSTGEQNTKIFRSQCLFSESPPRETPPLLFLDKLLYYQGMDAAVLIPIAFLVAGSIAIILTVYMVR